MGEVIMV